MDEYFCMRKVFLNNFEDVIMWHYISYYSNLSLEFIREHVEQLKWHELSGNQCITWDIVVNNQDLPWHWSSLSFNPNITCDIIVNNPDMPWNWAHLSYNKNLTWKFVQENMDKPWDFKTLGSNSCITWDIISQNRDKPWDYFRHVSMNPNITKDIVMENLDQNWSFPALLSHIDPAIINRLYIEPVYLKYLNTNPRLTWNFISGNNMLLSMAHVFSKHKCITWDVIQAHPEIEWNWIDVCTNPNITWEIVQANPDKPWNWIALSSNKNITWSIVSANIDKPWCWAYISDKEDISWTDVLRNLDKPFFLHNIFKNKFFDWDTETRVRIMREKVAEGQIKRALLEAFFNPAYAYCRRRLERDFANMQKIE